jgi:hypothetical protein
MSMITSCSLCKKDHPNLWEYAIEKNRDSILVCPECIESAVKIAYSKCLKSLLTACQGAFLYLTNGESIPTHYMGEAEREVVMTLESAICQYTKYIERSES